VAKGVAVLMHKRYGLAWSGQKAPTYVLDELDVMPLLREALV